MLSFNVGEREAEATSNMAESVLVSINSNIHVLYAIKGTLLEDGDQELMDTLIMVSSLLGDMEEIKNRHRSRNS